MSISLMAAALIVLPQVTVDAAKKEVRVPCKIAPRKLPNLPEIYPIEVAATLPAPKGQKAHETVVVFDVVPSEVHKALESLGLKPGKPVRGEGQVTGALVDVLLVLPKSGNLAEREVRIESVMLEKRTGRPLPPLAWHFTGSVPKDGKYGADVSGTLISLYPVTDEVVLQSAFTMKEEGLIKVDTAKALLPPEGTPVTLVLRAASGPPAAAAAAGNDPERQVLKLSRDVGPGSLPAPSVPSSGASAASSAPSDPFEHRREVRGAALPDVVRPVDAAPAKP
jgi:hypothetical protein